MSVNKEFKRLKALRAERGLTQAQMAKIIGIGEDTYRKKENGVREFTLSEVARAKEKLEIDPQYYFFYIFSNQTVTRNL